MLEARVAIYNYTCLPKVIGNSKKCALKGAFGPMEQQTNFNTFSLAIKKIASLARLGYLEEFGTPR